MTRPDPNLFDLSEAMRLCALRIMVMRRDHPALSEWVVRDSVRRYVRVGFDPKIGPPCYGPRPKGVAS